MASILGKLFGSVLGGSGPKEGKKHDTVDYDGYQIEPTPRAEGGQWLTAGIIRKSFGEDVKEHHFVRADKHASEDAAADFAITKARQIIDQQKDQIFS